MDSRPEPTRVFIISEVRATREALVQALAAFPSVSVAGSRAPDEEALAELATAHPDAVLVDWLTLRGATLVPRLDMTAPGSAVIAFGVAEEEGEVLACAAAGVAGYIPRNASLEALIRMIGAVARGELLCSPHMAAVMFRRLGSLVAPRPQNGCAPGPPLTPREAEIADLLEHGLSNKEIARALGIRVATVKNHVHHILERLQVSRRAEAAVAHRQRNHHYSPAG